MKLTILGKPKQKQGFMFTRTGIGYKNKDVVQAEQNIRSQIINQLPEGFTPYECPMRVESILYVFPILSTFPRWLKKMINEGTEVYKTTKPDMTDNLQKGLLTQWKGLSIRRCRT